MEQAILEALWFKPLNSVVISVAKFMSSFISTEDNIFSGRWCVCACACARVCVLLGFLASIISKQWVLIKGRLTGK